MLTRPTKFTDFQYRSGPIRYIVKIYDGTSTWLFSHEDSFIGTSTIYGLLTYISGAGSDIDVFKNVAKTAAVTLKFSNAQYRRGKSDSRLSDVWHNMGSATVDVYLSTAPNPAAITDCLKIFTGRMSEGLEITRDEVTMRAEDSSGSIHKTLPETIVGDVYPDAPLQNRYLRLPIQYGTFSHPGDSGLKVLSGNGPCPTVNIGDGKFCLSDHPLKSVAGMWVSVPGLGGMVCEIDYSSSVDSMTADDSDRGTAAVSTLFGSTTSKAYAYLYPNAVSDTENVGTVSNAANDADDPINVCSDDDTYAVIGAVNDSLSLYFLDDFGPGDNAPLGDNGVGVILSVHYQWRGECPGSASITGGYLRCLSTVGYGTTSITEQSTPETWQTSNGTTGDLDFLTADAGIFWAFNRGELSDPGTVYIYLVPTGGTPDSGELLYIYALRFRLTFQYQVSIINDNPCFAECTGMIFGSWIDHADHDNDFDEGDLIESPVYMIESILIDWLGVDPDDIDHASFDAAHDANLTAKLSIHNGELRNSSDIIADLCFQSMSALFYNPEGKWRLISWNKPVDVINDTSTIIEYDYIESPEELRLYKSPRQNIVNDLRIYHSYQYSTGKYNRVAAFESTGSQSKYDMIVQKDINIQNLDADSVAYFGARLVSDGAFWAGEWPCVQFNTQGATYAHLEVGDFIRFDVDAIGGVVSSSAINWQATDFMITKVRYTNTGTEFTAMLTPGRLTIDVSGDPAVVEIDTIAATYSEEDPPPPP